MKIFNYSTLLIALFLSYSTNLAEASLVTDDSKLKSILSTMLSRNEGGGYSRSFGCANCGADGTDVAVAVHATKKT